MRICIVGGTGNITTSVVRQLLELGHDVTCFNRGQRGKVPEGARLICGDRHDLKTFQATMQREKFDAAIDAICFNAQDAQSDIEAFRGVGHLIQISTVCTYGVAYDWLPVTEDHPLRPISAYGRNKVAADQVFMDAFVREDFPVTIVKPSTTYGPQQGILRQIAWEFSWLRRIQEGRPILICGDGHAIHQFLHVDDAARAMVAMMGQQQCVGQIYNLVRRGFTTWKTHHETVMRMLEREVELIGVSCRDLEAFDVAAREICMTIFAHNCYYSSEKLFADVPAFAPQVSLADGLHEVYQAMEHEDRIPASPPGGWEDLVIQRIQSSRGRTVT